MCPACSVVSGRMIRTLAAVARDGVGGAQVRTQRLPDDDQHLVTDGWRTCRWALEVIDVNQHDRERCSLRV
jgi:hypothetical protein